MDMVETKKKNKKKKRKSNDPGDLSTADIMEPVDENADTKVSHKKKKNKDHEIKPSVESSAYEVVNDTNDLNDINANGCDLEVHEISRKKKKKKKKHGEEIIGTGTVESNCSDQKVTDCFQESKSFDIPKKSAKKKKKHSKEIAETSPIKPLSGETKVEDTAATEEDEIQVSTVDNGDLQKHKKKHKKHKRKLNDEDQEGGPNHKHLAESSKLSDSKRAKLENKHMAITDKHVSEESVSSGHDMKTGQWSSADLGDSDRQNKFMRLLGGFKQGSNPSLLKNKFGLGSENKINPLKRPGGNFAMNKDQQDAYNKKLENDYEIAMGMNLNRGMGLGFEKPPEEGKKFYIDTKSSKSIKFD